MYGGYYQQMIDTFVITTNNQDRQAYFNVEEYIYYVAGCQNDYYYGTFTSD